MITNEGDVGSMVLIEQLLHETKTISDSYKRVAEATGENFNIFSILQVESDEVATHSRFIAELLNRKGSHGLKERFLSLFLKRFAEGLDFEPAKSRVFVEYYVGKLTDKSGGRIDVLIQDDFGRTVMVENKIYAGEQHNQLIRYHNAFPQGKLFYLTLFGEESSNKNARGLYEPLSFETDIINWLEDCRKESVNVPIIRETISQYINLVKKLTHQNLNKKMNQDIVNRVVKDEYSLRSYKILFDAHKDIKRHILSEVILRMKSRLVAKGFSNITTMNLNNDRGELISFQTAALERRNLKIRLNFEGKNYSNLILGFINLSNKVPKDKELYARFKGEFPNGLQSDMYASYIHYDKYQNWYFDTLIKIYFDEDESFYKDLEEKVERMLLVLDADEIDAP